MSEILFILGAGLLLVGRIQLGNINAEGTAVRTAGFVLTTPLVSRIVLGLVAPSLSLSAALVDAFEFAILVASVSAAYALVYREQQPVEQQQVEQQQEKPSPPPQQTAPSAPLFKPRPQPRKDRFPSVMSLAEAASYLNTTEKAVIDLINEGKITAARINYRYRISRAVLDDFIQQNNAE